MKLTSIGCGNMATAILSGMFRAKLISPKDVTVTARTKETLERARAEFGVYTKSDNAEAVAVADLVLLAVKPQNMDEVLQTIRPALKRNAVILSIAAGCDIRFFEERLGKTRKIVRAMPNTPSHVREGMTAFCTNEKVTETDKKTVQKILSSFGVAEEVPEDWMDIIGALSGCSPAYFYMMAEAMADAAVAEGMPRDAAYRFVSQAMAGSGKMLLKSGRHPGELKDAVCSPGGSTIEGVNVLEEEGFRGTVMEAIRAAVEKNRML